MRKEHVQSISLGIGNDNERRDAKSLPHMANKIRDEDNAAATSAAATMIAAFTEEGHKNSGKKGTKTMECHLTILIVASCFWWNIIK